MLNGGTGVGKTSAIMSEVKVELENKFQKPQTMLVVESRTATVNQLNENYADAIERINGIDVCQRISFMNIINRDAVNYDWVVIDECHGLFSEASFAQDAEYIASWIRCRRGQVHIIFITANDEYFEELSRQYFPGNFNFIYLFPDFTHYVSNTYVKEIQFIKTNRTDNVILTLLNKLHDKKGIIFLKRASSVKDWFFQLLACGKRVGMIVSQANETAATLTTTQAKQARDAAIDISGGQAGLTMADLCELFDTMREQQGKEGIRLALNHERLPDDIDILLSTDTIQEGISIKSEINYIIVEGFTEVEVRQKLGRFRGNLDFLFIVFNTNVARSQTLDKKRVFEKLLNLQNEGNQTALAEFYGAQKASKSTVSFLVKRTDQAGNPFYEINVPAYLNCQSEYKLYTKLVNDTEQTVIETYSYPLLTGAPKILNYNEDIRQYNLEEKIAQIVDKWAGIPLKGKTQEEFVQDCIAAEFLDGRRKKITTFRGCCQVLDSNNVKVVVRKATRQDLLNWPQSLTKIKEEYRVIEKGC